MALETTNPPTTPSAQMVGNAFVEQYYHILHHSPELVYRFYQDSSVISRPDSTGQMTSVTTMKGINEKILSLDYKDYKAEIKTADAQNSYKKGVTVLVTGCLTGKDKLRRNFTQSFFLAPQDNGFFVLNDVFRYVEDCEPLKTNPVNYIDDSPTVPLTPDPETTHIPNPSVPDTDNSFVEEDQNLVEKAQDTLDNEKQLASEQAVAVESQSNSNGNDASIVAASVVSTSPEDVPKKSYASIVKVKSTKVYVPTNTLRVASNTVGVASNTVGVALAKTDKLSSGSVAPAPVPEASAKSDLNPPENSNPQEEVEGYSIYIRNLPLNIMVPQLEVEFKKFGTIKKNGVQVRSHKLQGHCFGFVEFQSVSSMQKAIQASPITIGDRQAIVEIKKTTARVGGWRGRFPPGRGGFRNDNFRGHGNFVGGRGYGRNDFGNRGEFSGRGWGPSGRGGEGYQRGRGGRFIRSIAAKQNAITA